MTSRITKRNEKVKFREKLFCSIHERPTIGDCFPAAAAFSALSTSEWTFFTFSFQFFFSIFRFFNFIVRPTIGDCFSAATACSALTKGKRTFFNFSFQFFFSSILSWGRLSGIVFLPLQLAALWQKANELFSHFLLIFLFNFSFLQFHSEADYRGLFFCRYSLQRSDKRQTNFFQFFFSIFLFFNFILRPTIVDFS